MSITYLPVRERIKARGVLRSFIISTLLLFRLHHCLYIYEKKNEMPKGQLDDEKLIHI